MLPHLEVGGAERHLLQVLPRLDRRRFAASVCSTHGPGSYDGPMRDAGVPVFAPARTGHGVAALPGKALHFLRTARIVGPDLVHFFLPQAYLVGGPLAVLLGLRPRVMSRRSLNDYQRRHPVARRIERRLHCHMDAVVANSRAVAANLLEEGVDPKALSIIANGIDTGRFAAIARAEARAALGLGDDEMVIVCVANLIPYKGHADLVDALAAATLPSRWRCLLAGRDTAGIGPALDARAAALGIGDRIVRLGLHDDVPALLAAADIFVLASHEEGSPNSLAEAMAAGVAVVATAAGGTAELVDDGRTGLLTPPRDPAALAAAISRIAADSGLRHRLGTAARDHIAGEHSIAACVARYEALYEGLLARRPLRYAGPA
ncbi:MAG: glycosyltransferase [Alphaproteobacteria bacterium]